MRSGRVGLLHTDRFRLLLKSEGESSKMGVMPLVAKHILLR